MSYKIYQKDGKYYKFMECINCPNDRVKVYFTADGLVEKGGHWLGPLLLCEKCNEQLMDELAASNLTLKDLEFK